MELSPLRPWVYLYGVSQGSIQGPLLYFDEWFATVLPCIASNRQLYTTRMHLEATTVYEHRTISHYANDTVLIYDAKIASYIKVILQQDLSV